MTKVVLVLVIVAIIVVTGCMSTSSNGIDPSARMVINVSNYSSFDAALAACPASRQCALSVPVGTFRTSHYGAACISQSNIAIIGSGQPAYDNPDAPTKLVGGTIIQPGLAFCGASNISVSDLGLDDGPAYVAGGGTVTDGLAYDGANDPNPTDPFWTNDSAERVTSLGSSNGALAHAFRFEHGKAVSFSDLQATYDTHCLAIKSQYVTGGRVTTQACLSDQVTIKAISTAPSKSTVGRIWGRARLPQSFI